MDVVALVLWIVTAVGGVTMAGIWLANRGPTLHAHGTSRIGPRRVGLHAGLAVTGLALWVVSLLIDHDAPGWVALALLPVVGGIGFLMFMTWLAGRGVVAPDLTPPEQRIPAFIVAAHGTFAVATVSAVIVALLS